MKHFSRETLVALMGDGETRIWPPTTALVIVDLQRSLLDPDGAFGRIWSAFLPEATALYFSRLERLVLPNVERLLERCRAFAMPIVFTALGSEREDGGDLARWARRQNAISRHLVGGPIYPPRADPSWRIHETLGPAPGDRVLGKTTSGAVASTPLAAMLRKLERDTVILAGVATDGSVGQTARELADLGFRTVIVCDACAGLDERRHEAALESFTIGCGQVATTRAVLTALPQPIAGAA